MILRVVVVDDDPDMLDFLELLLESQGLIVTTSDYTGDVAGLIRETRPDVVMLDLQNGADRRAGLTVLDQLRADPVTARTPVFLQSADHGALNRHAGRIQELDATPIPKSLEPDRLLTMIQRVAA